MRRTDFTPADTRRAMRLSLFDGAAFAAMVGLVETYFLADVVRLGGSALEQGLVVSLPLFVGASGPLVMLRLLASAHRRRPFVVASVIGQVLVLAALAFSGPLGLDTPRALIAGACLYQVFGQGAGTAWSSWYGDVVPSAVRGRYFAMRNRLVHGTTCAGLLAGGLVLEVLEPGPVGGGLEGTGAGFRAIFLAAALIRLSSVVLLAVSPEPHFHRPPEVPRALRFLATERGSGALRLVLLITCLQFAVWIASPYFAPHMLTNLSFSYTEYTVAYVCIVVFKVLFLPVWGQSLDKHGARWVVSLAALCLALGPLPWLWARGLGWVLIGQAFAGLSWAGFELAQFALVLESSYKSTRAHVFAALALGNGTAQLLGTLTGAWILARFDDSMHVVFAVSLVARLAIAFAFPSVLPARAGGTPVRRRDLLLRVIGIRPSGGVVHRPIDAPQERSPRTGAETGEER